MSSNKKWALLATIEASHGIPKLEFHMDGLQTSNLLSLMQLTQGNPQTALDDRGWSLHERNAAAIKESFEGFNPPASGIIQFNSPATSEIVWNNSAYLRSSIRSISMINAWHTLSFVSWSETTKNTPRHKHIKKKNSRKDPSADPPASLRKSCRHLHTVTNNTMKDSHLRGWLIWAASQPRWPKVLKTQRFQFGVFGDFGFLMRPNGCFNVASWVPTE